MSSLRTAVEDGARWLAPRLFLVASAAVPGFTVGALAVPILAAYLGAVRLASENAFAAAALLFGFALLGWSGSILAGQGIESMQQYLDTRTDWSETDSRRAMARIGGFGAGGMMGTILATLALS